MSVGPTGKFPDGKLHPGDDGELAFGVAKDSSGRIHVNFGKPVAWFTLPRETAIQFARLLLKHAGAKKVEIEF